VELADARIQLCGEGGDVRALVRAGGENDRRGRQPFRTDPHLVAGTATA
jgi:hypothetical protein